jgi:hypothetical protein
MNADAVASLVVKLYELACGGRLGAEDRTTVRRAIDALAEQAQTIELLRRGTGT